MQLEASTLWVIIEGQEGKGCNCSADHDASSIGSGVYMSKGYELKQTTGELAI